MAEEYDYPEDEFDRLAKERKVLGAHREVQSNRPWWIAVIAIIVIVPLLAWVFVRIGAVDSVTDKVTTPRPAATPTQTETPEPAKDPSPEDKKEIVDTSLQIFVLNGSGISGLAASKAEILNGEGFANTVADNYAGGADPAESTVYYANEDDAATAEKVGSALGISQVELSPEYVSDGTSIVVVLRADAA